jgi:Fe-Mn family superoxide dismutase
MTTRREFLAVVAAAGVLRPGLAGRQEDGGSALVTGRLKSLKADEIKGFLSKEQLALHHTAHYGGAVKSLAQIESELESADRSKANANYSAVRELKREQAHAMNSVVLHELYFDGIAAAPADPREAAQDVLRKRFGSVDKWVEDFKAAAVSARGWAILAWQPVNGRLYNVVTDMHDIGVMVFGVPLVLIDCYEHAFYVDYRNKKGDYVSAYPKHIDWAEIESRIQAAVK